MIFKQYTVTALLFISGLHQLCANFGTPGPEQVIVVANAKVKESLDVARYYMEKRGIPDANLYTVSPPDSETLSWPDFVDTIYNPLLTKLTADERINATSTSLKDGYGRLRYIRDSGDVAYMVLCYGMPYKIEVNLELSEQEEEAFIAQLPPRQRAQYQKIPNNGQRNMASVDAELAALLYRDVPANRFINNPAFKQDYPWLGQAGTVIRVARLDGPSAQAAKTMVDSALQAESEGLMGRAYFDLRGPHAKGDEWIQGAANTLRKLGFDYDTEDTGERFSASDRFDAPALYFGWYAAHADGPFVNDGFRFPTGAVAVHIHSFSAHRLRSTDKEWCGPMIARGCAATLGNVYEPYLEYTHHLDLFAEALAKGWNLGEAAYYALPKLSWQAIVVGDPLYTPFKVSLPDQLSQNTDSKRMPSTLKQYAVIRRINQLLNQNKPAEALALAEKERTASPGLALNLKYAELLTQDGQQGRAKDILQATSKLRYFSADDWGLVATIARQLEALGANKEAYETIENLMKRGGMRGETRLQLLDTAINIASKAGKTQKVSDWASERELLKVQLNK